MAHKWEPAYNKIPEEYFRGPKRVCKNCGAIQYHDAVSYDRIDGSTYAWTPKAGRCTINKTRKSRKTI